MSGGRTGADSLAALQDEQHRVELLPTLRDVDTGGDVEAVAQGVCGRFGALTRALHPIAAVVS